MTKTADFMPTDSAPILSGFAATRRTLRMVVPKGERLAWLGLIVLALFTAAIEVLGGLIVFAVVGVLTGAVKVADLPVFSSMVDLFGVGDDTRGQIVLFAVVVSVFYLIRGAVVLFQVYAQAKVTEMAGLSLSVRLLRGYLSMPYRFFLERNSAELTRNAFWSARNAIGYFLAPMVRIASEVLVALGFFVLLWVAAPEVTIIAIVAVAPLMVLVLRFVRKRLNRLGKVVEDEAEAGLKFLQEGFQGIREIKLQGSADYISRLFERSRREYAMAYVLQEPLANAPRALLELLIMVFMLTWLVISSSQSLDATSLARLGVFAYAALRLMPAMNRIIAGLAGMKFGAAAMNNVADDLVRLEEQSTVHLEAEPAVPYVLDESISLRDVTFRYEAGREPALSDIDLEIEQGQTVGIVGETGVGKSTLLDLILGLHEPTSGEIFIDGNPLDGMTREWQASIGVVSQAFFLSDDTLRRNIAFGLEEEEIDDDRVGEVVRVSQLEEFVETLPDGLETYIGEGGLRLSGGQRQRVAIARALYRDPPVLVFDEGTSALDSGTETELMKAVKLATQSRTVIMVAHRISTVLNADKIVLLVDGRIDDIGRFDELASRNSRFGVLAAGVSSHAER